MDKVGIAIVGCGYWGLNYVRVFSELPEAKVVVVCDKREDRLEEVARRFPGLALVPDVQAALCLEGVEAVVVCTPATTHCSIARAALLAGKHVLVEKPITTQAVECCDLNDLADSHQLILMVGHTFLFNPAVRKVKEYIQRGEAGRIYYLYARRTNMGPIRHDVNAVWDLAPHDVSIFNYLLASSPDWVSAVGARVLGNNREDVGFISLGYQSNILAHIHVSWADANKVREVVVVGSEKRIVFNDVDPLERVRVFEKGIALAEPEGSSYGEHQFRMRDGDIISPRIEASEPLKNQCSHFLECVKKGIRPLSDGRAGQDVVQVMEAIDRSIEHRGAPVEIVKEN